MGIKFGCSCPWYAQSATIPETTYGTIVFFGRFLASIGDFCNADAAFAGEATVISAAESAGCFAPDNIQIIYDSPVSLLFYRSVKLSDSDLFCCLAE